MDSQASVLTRVLTAFASGFVKKARDVCKGVWFILREAARDLGAVTAAGRY